MSKKKKSILITSFIALSLFTIISLRHELHRNASAQSSEDVTIYAHKVVCISEKDLPNWGEGGSDVPSNISSNTAQEFVEESEGNCWLAEDWEFQWGYDKNEEEGIDGVHKLIGDYIGTADGTPSSCAFQCGSNTDTGSNYEDWKDFDTKTGSNGSPAKITIDDMRDAPGIWVREKLKSNYIPYTYPPKGSFEDNVTAELYCHYDVRNYDNYDLVWNPEPGKTYYCVGFNVPKGDSPDLQVTKDDGVTKVTPGSETTYILKIENVGNRISTGITVTDTLPNDTQFISSSDNGQHNNGIVTWEIDQLAPGETIELSLTIKIDEQIETDEVTNFVSVEDDGQNGEDENTENNSDKDTDEIEESEGPLLQLTKTNNKIGEKLETDDNVRYTLTLKALGDLSDVTLIDLPPEGFTYINGTWTANSSVAGNIKGSVVSEPTYASPGTWNIGNMKKEEVITLTYVTDIEESVDSGIYKDLAWAKGDFGQQQVLANENSNQDIFVGTEVEVVEPNPSPEVEVDIDVEEIVQTQVLGASSARLPETGANDIWIIMLITLFLSGIVLVAAGLLGDIKKTKILAVITGLLIGALLITNKAHAATNTLSVRIEEPENSTNEIFKIGFVALDIENKNVEAKCMVKKPGSVSFTQFGNIFNLGNGGNSDNCNVNNSVLSEEGTYEFKVNVSNGTDTIESEIVKVRFDETGPERPKWIEKDQKSECKYEIKFKTADDEGQTNYVEIYRSDDNEFDADEDSRIKTVYLGSNEEYEFEDAVNGDDCKETQYYAVRAFDSAGNPSKVRSEGDIENVVIKEIEGDSEETEQSEIVLISSDLTSSSDNEGQNNDRNIEDFGIEIEGEDFGDVLGDEDAELEFGSPTQTDNETNFPWLLLLPIVLLGIYLIIRNKD